MKFYRLMPEGPIVIEPDIFSDTRGWFVESWSARKYREFGIDAAFVQDNHSYSAHKGTLRGLHYQTLPHSQGKLIRCTRGAILDVAVDIRKNSPTFAQWVSVELRADNFKQLYVPRGFAHGFLTLTDECEIQYKADDFYCPDNDRSILWCDPDIGIDWGITTPILSDKDMRAPHLADADNNFIYGEPI